MMPRIPSANCATKTATDPVTLPCVNAKPSLKTGWVGGKRKATSCRHVNRSFTRRILESDKAIERRSTAVSSTDCEATAARCFGFATEKVYSSFVLDNESPEFPDASLLSSFDDDWDRIIENGEYY